MTVIIIYMNRLNTLQYFWGTVITTENLMWKTKFR